MAQKQSDAKAREEETDAVLRLLPPCDTPALFPQVLANIDELFDRTEFSAAPDPGWPDCFNSGVFVFQPSLETHGLLLRHAADHGSFDGRRRGPR